MYIYILKFYIVLIIKMSIVCCWKGKSFYIINEKFWKIEESCYEV